MRVFVELKLNQAIPQGQSINFKGEKLWIPFTYKKLPRICFKCGQIILGIEGCPLRDCISFNQYGIWLRANSTRKFSGHRFEGDSSPHVFPKNSVMAASPQLSGKETMVLPKHTSLIIVDKVDKGGDKKGEDSAAIGSDKHGAKNWMSQFLQPAPNTDKQLSGGSLQLEKGFNTDYNSEKAREKAVMVDLLVGPHNQCPAQFLSGSMSTPNITKAHAISEGPLSVLNKDLLQLGIPTNSLPDSSLSLKRWKRKACAQSVTTTEKQCEVKKGRPRNYKDFVPEVQSKKSRLSENGVLDDAVLDSAEASIQPRQTL